MVAGVALRADAEHACLAGAQAPHVRFGSVDLFQDTPRRRQHALAGARRHHPFSQPEEQRRPEPLFDAAQLMADRRLCQVQQVGRLRHAAGAGDRRHHAQMPDVDVHDQDSSIQ